jgi:membrane peptidoglycan carboxypeptidase
MGRAEERRARQRGGRRAAPSRRRSSPTADRSLIRRLFTWKKILGTFFGLILLGMGAFIVLYMVIDIPEGNADAQRQGNVYKYSDGSIMARKGYNREIVDLAKVPKDVQHTFVAAENKTFYKDSGVDLKGTARGVLNTLSGKGAQGGSTITQQYVKNYYLTQDQTVSRKLKELVISLKLDREKPKDYILAGYINTSYYGRGAYGIQAAAQAYYRVDAEDLTVEQGAYLAALLQAPNQYDWAIASDTGKRLVQERWNYVLNNMVEQKWLNKADRQAMTFPVPKEPKPAPGMEGQTGYLVEAANSALKKQLVAGGTAEDMKQAEAMVEEGGWTVTLNVDKKKQTALEGSSPASSTRPSATWTPTSRPAPCPWTRRPARSWRCTAAWTTSSTSATTPPATTTSPRPPSSRSSSPPPWTRTPRRRTACRSRRTPCTTARASAPWWTAARRSASPPRTRTTPTTATSTSRRR